jgi:thymidylate kinase
MTRMGLGNHQETAMLSIAICGVKGAGKSTTIGALDAALSSRGIPTRIFAPFAAGNAAFFAEGGLVPMMRNGDAATAARISAWLRDACAQEESDFARANPKARSVLLFDRHWITAKRALDGAPIPASEAEAIWRRDWMKKIVPPTFFIHTSPANTLERRKGQLDAISGLETENLVVEDYRERLRLRDAWPQHIVGDHETPLSATDAIVADILSFIDISRKTPHTAFGDMRGI